MDTTPEALRNILRSLLGGELQCWIVSNNSEVHGYALTTIAEDNISKSKFLNIYDIFAFRELTKETSADMISALKEFAKANNCKKITAYSNIVKIVGLAEAHGFNSDIRFLILEV